MTKRTTSRYPWFPEDVFPLHSSIPLFTRLSHGWYRLTAVADPPAHASFHVREISRLSRFLSSIVGCLLFIFLGFLPACLDLSNQYVLVADSIMLPICQLALLLGRQGKVIAGGTLLMLSFEVALTIVIVTTRPFDEASIQQYDLFVFGELFAVSLLPAGSVFAVACYNSVVIAWSLLYQFQTPHLQMMVQTQGLPLLVRPVAVQWLVAVVMYLWVRSALRAYQHADRVEAVAKLEHHHALEERARAEARAELVESVERLPRHHVQVINHRSVAPYTPIPVHSYPQLLVPLVSALNLLHRRLLEARQIEWEYGRLQWDIFRRVEQLERHQLEELKQPGGTALDTLLVQCARHCSLPNQIQPGLEASDQEAL